MIALGRREVVLQFINILVVAHGSRVVAAVHEGALHGDGGRSVLGNIFVSKTAVLKTDVVDDVLAQHQAVTHLQSVLHALRVGGLARKRQGADTSVGGNRTEKIVTKGQ